MPVLRIVLPILSALFFVAMIAATAVALRFGFDPALGTPVVGLVYHPFDVWHWAFAWGLEPAYRTKFLQGIGLALLPLLGLVAIVVLQTVRDGRFDRQRARRRAQAAGLGRPADLLKLDPIATAGPGIVLGRDGRRILRDHGDAHVLVSGGTRSGKGAGHVVPTLLTWPGSMLAFDPKGDLAQTTAERRAAFGRVLVLDPLDAATAAFNPFLELKGSPTLSGDCQMAARMLAQGGERFDHDFWDDAAAKLILAACLDTLTGPKPTLATLWQCVQAIERGHEPRSAHPEAQALLDGHAAKDARIRSSINETVTTRLFALSDPLVQRLTDRSDFRAGDFQAGTMPLTVYLTVRPAHAERLRPVTRLLIQSILSPLLLDERRTADGRAKQRPLLVLLDEFAQLGCMRFLQKGLDVCASYGIRAMLVCQDTDQIAAAYGPHQNVTTNCTTQCVIPSFSNTSLATYKSWGGETTVTHGSSQQQLGRLMNQSVGESETRVPTLDPGEMLRRGHGEVLVFTRGAAPTWLQKIRYYDDPAFAPLLRPGAPATASIDGPKRSGPRPFVRAAALLTGGLLAAPAAATIVAWRFGDTALGAPVFGPWHDPTAILGWARTWGLEPPYRADFLIAVTMAASLALVPPTLVEIGARLLGRRR